LSEVFLYEHTPNPEKVIARAARLCYSSATLEELTKEIDEKDVTKFVQKLFQLGHLSPFEHASATFGIRCSRACSHQLVRSRIASHCLSGDTIVKSYSAKKRFPTKQHTLKQLYDWSFDYKRKGRLKLINLRSIDEKYKILIPGKIKNIIYTGKQELYEVKTRCGRTIKSSLNELFFTEDGWKTLSELSVSDYIYANGISSDINKEWLKEMYLKKNIPRKKLAKIMKIGDSTLGKIIRKFNLQKPKSQYPNRHSNGGGKNGMFTKEGLERLKPSKIGDKNPSWKGEKASKNAGNLRAWRKYKVNICDTCGSKENLERHHIDKNTLNNDKDNILILCETCHRGHHVGQGIKTVFRTPITSIKYIGVDDTYDIEMEGPNFNFSANGLIVHNSQKSQRYVSENNFKFFIPKTIKESDLKMKYYIIMDQIELLYNEMKKDGIPNEDCRYILPNACETQIITTMNFRELLHFFNVRCCHRSQWEIRYIAMKMLWFARIIAPNIFMKAGPSCYTNGSCPEGKMSCGKSKWVKDIFSSNMKLIKESKVSDNEI